MLFPARGPWRSTSTHRRVFLILHALHQHPLDDVQIVLLLVPENTREVPEDVKSGFPKPHVLRADRVKKELQAFRPLVVAILIYKERNPGVKR